MRMTPMTRALCAAAAIAATNAIVRAAPPSSAYDLVFADEFSGTALDTVKWSAASPGWTMPNSASTASAAQVSLGGGNLTLNATRTSNTAFSSGSVSTYTKGNFTGGYVEARIQLPTTPGSWPAFWGLYDGWPPEMDIMEYPLTTDGGVSGYANNKYSTNYHYTNTSGNAAAGAGVVTTGVNLGTTGYHTFAADWTTGTSVRFLLDGNQVSSYTGASVAQMQSMYMILDYAVGGWPGLPSTSQWAVGASDQTLVDYVRVWQQRATGATKLSAWNVNGNGGWDAAANWSGLVPTLGGQQVTFGRVGNAATSNVTWTNSRTIGGITFSGDGTGTTAYTLAGGTNASIQLAGSSGANAYVEALATNTADQSINSRVELYNYTNVTNNSANAILLNGQIVGDGGLSVNGPGVVVFSNNNTYAGNTDINPGTQGAAVARVTRSRPFGTTGTLTIGVAGNLTTARVEIQDGREVPNAVTLPGRAPTNASVAIRNLSGNNLFSGTITATAGGSNYRIESDAGLLTLSGNGTGATNGVSLTVNASSARTFTLGGAGDGLVSGKVANGNAPAALAKVGLGTWTLSAANAFSGGVNVSAGTLVADNNAALGTSVTSVASGGTLAVAAGRNVTGLTGLSVATGGALSFAGNGSLLALAGGTFAIGDVTFDLNHAYDALGTYTLIDGVAGANALGRPTFVDVNPAYLYSLAIVGNDALLTVSNIAAVPEPTTLAAVAVGAGLLSRRRRV